MGEVAGGTLRGREALTLEEGRDGADLRLGDDGALYGDDGGQEGEDSREVHVESWVRGESSGKEGRWDCDGCEGSSGWSVEKRDNTRWGEGESCRLL